MHGLEQISIVRDNADNSKLPELLAIFNEPTSENRVINPYTLRLKDREGAEFTPTRTLTKGKYTYATFPDFPRKAQVFRLSGYAKPERMEQEDLGADLFDLTLTNLWRMSLDQVRPYGHKRQPLTSNQIGA